MPQLGNCAGCGGSLWQEANGEPKFCDTCLGDGTAEATTKAAEKAEKDAEKAEERAAKADQ